MNLALPLDLRGNRMWYAVALLRDVGKSCHLSLTTSEYGGGLDMLFETFRYVTTRHDNHRAPCTTIETEAGVAACLRCAGHVASQHNIVSSDTATWH